LDIPNEPISRLLPIERETYTLPEACARLGYPRSTGYDLARRGDFPVPVIKAGRSLRVSKVLIDRLLNGESGLAD
jgi:predicted DNA-binding transcriptional regulator AlpA